MRLLASLLLLAAAPALASAQASKEELKKLAKARVSDDVMLAYLRSHGYRGMPSSDDLVDLKQAGLSDKVLVELISLAEPETDSSPAAPAAESVSASGTLSVSTSHVYPRSYFTPIHRPYYTGAICRGSPRYAYSRGYCGTVRPRECR
jgi:hypothetical protein